jgi:hypothetical protein
MKINYNVTGAERKSLVAAISRELNQPTKYLGAPTFAYEVGSYRIDKNGILEGEDNPGLVADLCSLHGFKADSEEYDTLPSEAIPLTEAEELGLGKERREDFAGENGMQASDVPESYTYQAELSDPDYPDRMEIFSADDDEDAIRQAREFCTGEIVLLELFQTDDDYNRVRGVELKPSRLVLQMPLTGFTPEKLDNLTKLVNAKAPLLKAALNAEELPIQHTNETLDFPWFQFTEDSEMVKAYMMLICQLCKTAIEKKRVTAKEKPMQGSSRYAFRCFLLSLGFIGDEYKLARKILLNGGGLSGNTRWKSKEEADGGSEDE